MAVPLHKDCIWVAFVNELDVDGKDVVEIRERVVGSGVVQTVAKFQVEK